MSVTPVQFPPVLVALDLETTGLHPQLSEIVEIGAIAFDAATGEVVAEHASLVNPGKPIPANVTAIHGITDTMVQDAPPVREAMTRLLAFLEPYDTVLGHNVHFDLSFLLHRARQQRQPFPANWTVDTVHLARWAFPGLVSYRLSALKDLFDLQSEAHRAIPDAIACAQLFCLGIAELGRKGFAPVEITGRLCKPLLSSHQPAPESITPELKALYDICATGQRLCITYRNAQQEVTRRVVDPQGVEGLGPMPTLVAYCHFKAATRHFRTDRILTWEVVDGLPLDELLTLQGVLTAPADEPAPEPWVDPYAES